MPDKISGRSLWRCFLRSNMPGAAYNLRGLQNLGFTWSMLPGLRELYPAGEDFTAACLRYAVFHNCHPFWGPYLTGAFLNLERSIAAGHFDPVQFGPIREAMLNSLSAIGDSFFSGSLNTLLLLGLTLLAGLGFAGAACLLLLFWLLASLGLKAVTFLFGLRRGFYAMTLLHRFDLINWGDFLKVVNALVLLVFLAVSLQPGAEPGLPALLRDWFLPLALLVLFAVLSARLHYSRSILLSLLLLLLVL